MSLLELQRALCGILTDARARHAFLSDRETFVERLDLTVREKECLCQLDQTRVGAYARMLINSRIDLALMALPHARAFLPTDFFDRYGPSYVRSYPPALSADGPPLLRELRRFVEFLEYLAVSGDIKDPRFLDALYYDSTLFFLGNDPDIHKQAAAFEREQTLTSDQALNPESKLLRSPAIEIRTFSAGLVGVSHTVEPQADGQPVHLIFQKRLGKTDIDVFSVSQSTMRFVELCDGNRTLFDISSQFAQRYTADAALRSCAKVCDLLLKRRVIGFKAAHTGGEQSLAHEANSCAG